MTLAVAAPTSTQPTIPQTVPIVVLGTDALLAAAPATPVQLAHACLRAGYANVIPASWGDELIAAAVLRRLPHFGNGPAIQCSCPIVAHRLLSVGGDLRPAMVPTVAPPVAIARYVRTLSQPTRTRITYVGNCPGANDDSIDIRMRPDALLAMLAERSIVIEDQPRVFESIIPPDRRRFRSQPGGVPTTEALWNELGARALVEIDGEDLVTELAQQLLTGKNVLIDVAPRLGCACSGALAAVPPREARSSVVSLEPPRASTPVVEELAPIDLDLPIPAAPRTPVDVAAVPEHDARPRPVLTSGSSAMPLGHRLSPVRGMPAVVEARAPRVSNPISARPVMGALPVARDGDGRSLPRAYVARRRSSPKGMPAIVMPDAADDTGTAGSSVISAASDVPRALRNESVATATPGVQATPLEAPSSAAGRAPFTIASLTSRQMVYIAVAIVMLALSMSAVVGVIVGRLVRQPSAPITSPAP